jgi:hypothetical protein
MKLEKTLDTLIQVLEKIYTDDEFYEVFKSLRKYKFVNNLKTLKPGDFIRFIDLRDKSKGVSSGGFIIDLYTINPKISKSKYIRLKGANKRIFTINSDFNIMFTKLDEKELLNRYNSLQG